MTTTLKQTVPHVLMIAALFFLALSTPAHAEKQDSSIESSAKKSYVFKTYLKGDDIRIKSQNGAVILTGVVSENFHKTLAQETVTDIPGVKSVDNRLETRGAAPTANSDAWLRDKVIVMLSFHRSVSAAQTRIEVKDGIVTLHGNADNQAQKDLTSEYTKDIEGVTGVINDMTVGHSSHKKRTAGEKIDDASITAQVKMTLLYHRSTSALSTTVTTKRGIVTLAGSAKNAAEKEQATVCASDINGVISVKNEMTIK